MNSIRQLIRHKNIISSLKISKFFTTVLSNANSNKKHFLLAGSLLTQSRVQDFYSNFDLSEVKQFVKKKREREEAELFEEERESIVRKACTETEKKVNRLIKLLQVSIRRNCEKYRECVSRQTEILNFGLHKKKEQHWNELVQSRKEAELLRKELDQYQNLIEYVGQLAFNLALCAAVVGNLEAEDLVCDEFCYLQKLNAQQMSLNKACELKLFELDMKEVSSK